MSDPFRSYSQSENETPALCGSEFVPRDGAQVLVCILPAGHPGLHDTGLQAWSNDEEYNRKRRGPQ